MDNEDPWYTDRTNNKGAIDHQQSTDSKLFTADDLPAFESPTLTYIHIVFSETATSCSLIWIRIFVNLRRSSYLTFPARSTSIRYGRICTMSFGQLSWGAIITFVRSAQQLTCLQGHFLHSCSFILPNHDIPRIRHHRHVVPCLLLLYEHHYLQKYLFGSPISARQDVFVFVFVAPWKFLFAIVSDLWLGLKLVALYLQSRKKFPFCNCIAITSIVRLPRLTNIDEVTSDVNLRSQTFVHLPGRVGRLDCRYDCGPWWQWQHA